MIPIGGGGGGGRVTIEGHAVEPGREPVISFTGVTAHFYQTLGVGLLRGRNFSDAEGAAGVRTPVAVINETMAKRLWPNADALGGRFRMAFDPVFGRVEDGPAWFTVIGIAPDIKQDAINPGNSQPRPAADVPYNYQHTLSTGLTIRVASAD